MGKTCPFPFPDIPDGMSFKANTCLSRWNMPLHNWNICLPKCFHFRMQSTGQGGLLGVWVLGRQETQQGCSRAALVPRVPQCTLGWHSSGICSHGPTVSHTTGSIPFLNCSLVFWGQNDPRDQADLRQGRLWADPLRGLVKSGELCSSSHAG